MKLIAWDIVRAGDAAEKVILVFEREDGKVATQVLSTSEFVWIPK